MKEEKKVPILIEDLGMMYATENSKSKVRFGLYQCPYCENQFKANTYNVNKGLSASCGCLKKTTTKKHNLSKHKLYKIWNNMIERANKQRGISVCERWLKATNFFEDMHATFEEGLTLGRIDVNGNYELSNCRWVTPTTQRRNTGKLRSNNTSGYRGVYFGKKANKWFAMIGINSKQKHIGSFNTALEAAIAYDKYVIENNLEHTINGVLVNQTETPLEATINVWE